MFNDSLDMGVKGVLTAVSNVNNSLIEIQSKVTESPYLHVDSPFLDNYYVLIMSRLCLQPI